MKLDSVTLEIMSNKGRSIADEMAFTLMRAGRTLYVKETGDFSTALVDRAGKFFAYPEALPGGKAIIFTQMKHVANRVASKLAGEGVRGTAIHGNKSQTARTKALKDFKQGRVRVLVATDVAARGLDVDDITHVINYDLPMEAETYVHRIGRTARAGAKGNALSICTAEDRAYIHDIERLLRKPVPVDFEHGFHCNDAQRSKQPAPKQFDRNKGGNGRRNARPQGNFRSSRTQSRKRARR